MKCPKCKQKCRINVATYSCSTKTHTFYQISDDKWSLTVNFPSITARIYKEHNKCFVYLQTSSPSKHEISLVKRTQCYWFLEDWLNRYLKMSAFT